MANIDRDAKIKSTSSMLRAVLISARDGIPVYKVEKEYKDVTMESLPYRELGYGNALEFLKSLSDVARIETRPDGNVVVKAVPTKEDAHVAKLVAGQKKKKPKKSLAPIRRRQASAFKNYPAHFQTNSVPCMLPGLTKQISNGLRGFAVGWGPRNSGPYMQWSVNQSNINAQHPMITRGKAQLKGLHKNTGQKVHSQRNLPPRMAKLQNQQGKQPVGSNEMYQNFTIIKDNNTTDGVRQVIYNEVLNKDELEKVRANVVEMLTNIPYGLWDFALNNKYRSVFQEEPPKKLFGIITAEMRDIIDIEMPIPGKTILSIKKERPKSVSPTSQSGDSKDENESEENTSLRQTTDSKSVIIAEDVHEKFWHKRTVVICHVDNICKFYIQDADSETKLLELGDVLQEFYNGQDSGNYHLLSPVIGMYCCAQFTEDDLWCRAKILSIQEKNSTNPNLGRSPNVSSSLQNQEVLSCRVLYVDYGNQEVLQVNRIMKLKQDFAELPAQAVLCQLGSILPSEGENWTPEEIDVFKNLVEEKSLKCNVIKQEGNSLNIDLITEDDRSISSQIVESGNAVYSPNLNSTAKEKTGRNGQTSPILQRLGSLSLDSTESFSGVYAQFPVDPYVDVFVSNVNSVSDFTIIIDGSEHYEKLEALEANMLEYFSDPAQVSPGSIKIGEFYAAFSVDGWYRCKVDNIDGNKADVTFLDHGDRSTIEHQELRALPPPFLRLPFQALPCALHNVFDDADDKLNETFKELVIGKVFVASVIARNSKLFVELLETSSDEDKSINKELLRLKPEGQRLVPMLCKKEEDMRIEAYLVYTSDSGILHLQMPGPGFDQLEQIMEQATERFSKGSKAADFVKSPEVGSLYFAKATDNICWYRAMVIAVLPAERNVELEFVDFGDRQIVPMTSLRSAAAVSDLALTLPHQVVKCELSGLPANPKATWKEGLKEQLMEQVDERAVWVQTVSDATDKSLAVVHLYRTRDDGSVVERTLTEELLESLEISSSNSDETFEKGGYGESGIFQEEKERKLSNRKTPSPEVFRQTSYDLPADVLYCPPVGAYEERSVNPYDRGSPFSETYSRSSSISDALGLGMRSLSTSEEPIDELLFQVPNLKFPENWVDVIVVYVRNPLKFMIQLFSSVEALNEMQEDMRTYYQNSLGDKTPPPGQHLCAVYYASDDIWYRGLVQKSGLDDQVCIEFVDYGNFDLVPVSDVRRLAPQFCKLPFQAIPVKLAGIKSKSRLWTKKSENRLVELVADKLLVAKLLRNDLEIQRLCREPIKIDLFDTSDPTVDIIISDQLIADGHASVDTS